MFWGINFFKQSFRQCSIISPEYPLIKGQGQLVTRHLSTNEKARLCLSKHKSKHHPSDQKFSQQRTESDRISHRFKAFRHIFKTFHEAYTIFSSGQRIGSHIGSVSSNIRHVLWLISSFKQRDEPLCIGEILVGFQGRWTSIYYFFDSQISYEVLDIFPWLSYRLTFIMLNVGMVDNLEFW